MKTFRYDGNTIPYTNGGGSTLASSSVVVVTSGLKGQIGIVVDDIPAGGSGALAVQGVHELNALGTDTGNIGDRVYWDATNARLTVTASGNTPAGFLAEPKNNGDLTARVKLSQLNPGPSPIAAALSNSSLTDSTGGTPSATLAAVTAGASYAQADAVALKNAVSSLSAQLNALTTSLRAAGAIG